MTGPTSERLARGVHAGTRSARRRRRVSRATLASLGLGALGCAALAGTTFALTRDAGWSAAVVLAGLGALALGSFVGHVVWPEAGVRFAHLLLALYARVGRHRNAQLMITPYPDFVPGRLRQTWEAAAFAGGLALLAGVNVLVFTTQPPGALPWASLAALAVGCLMTFLLVPHWTFARLGLRLSQQGRFVVTSVAESYSRLVRVSNGTLLGGATFYGVTILMGRAARMEAYLTVGGTLAVLLVLSALVMASATAFFLRHDEEVVRRVAAEARRVGFVGVRAGRVASV